MNKIIMNSVLLLTLVCIPLLEMSADASGPVVVKVKGQSEITADEILLGDISEISGSEGVLIQKLKSLVIGNAPLPGKSKSIDDSIIRIRMKQNDMDPALVKLLVPADAQVLRGSFLLSATEIKSMVHKYLKETLPWDSQDISIKDIQVDGDVVLPKGNVSYQLDLPDKNDYLGNTTLAINVFVENELYKKIWAVADIRVYKNVIVSKRPLGRYKIINQEDIQLVRMDLTRTPMDAMTDIAETIGMRVRRTIDSQTVLKPDMLELPPLVKRGAVVSIIAESNSLKVVTLGKAKENGGKGQVVRVENMDSKKIVYARVVDETSVLVEF